MSSKIISEYFGPIMNEPQRTEKWFQQYKILFKRYKWFNKLQKLIFELLYMSDYTW